MLSHSNILFVLGLAGIVFYAVGPILFPGVPNIRQPELLPIYGLMLGLGGILHKGPIEPPTPPGPPVPVKDENTSLKLDS